MSLEAKIEALTVAVQNLQSAIDRQTREIVAVPVVVPAPATPAPVTPAPVTPAPVTPAPVIQPVPVQVAPAPVAQAAPVMPPLPTFAAPPVQPIASVPFNDPKGMIDYVMTVYKALGPQKGAEIQGVLVGLGVTNINDVKPEQYQALFTGIEMLKVKG